MIKFLLIFSLTSFLLLSCAKQTLKPKPYTYGSKSVEETFDADVEKEFSLIEMEQKQALEYYKQLRSRNWNKYKNGKSAPTKRRIRPRKKIIVKTRPAPKKKVIQEVMTPEQQQELEIEIGQNLSYYCMQHRKDRRFSSDADCQAFTQDSLSNCEESIGMQHHRNVLKCLKRKLKI